MSYETTDTKREMLMEKLEGEDKYLLVATKEELQAIMEALKWFSPTARFGLDNVKDGEGKRNLQTFWSFKNGITKLFGPTVSLEWVSRPTGDKE